MPTIEAEVPQWKKELILKRQLWRRSGGWSVPPVITSPIGLKVRPPDVGRVSDQITAGGQRNFSSEIDETDESITGSVGNLSLSESVSELKTKFQSDDEVFEPLTKARSEENILDVKVLKNSQRRLSSSQYSGYYHNGTVAPKINGKIGPKMEDFFKKYRKTTRKSVVEENEVDSPTRPPAENPKRKRSETVYFLDMNQNELPPPNTVRQTVKAFEEPVRSDQNSPKPDFDEMTSSKDVRARDVVRKFEEKIQSSGAIAPPKPPRSIRRNDTNKPVKPPKPSILAAPPDRQKELKHVSFNTDVVPDRKLNPRTRNEGATDISSIQNGLRAVTINTNQPIIIKTV